MFLLSRGPYAFFGAGHWESRRHGARDLTAPLPPPPPPTPGYGWLGCASPSKPFTRPPSIEREYGVPLNFCSQTAPGSGVWTRNFTLADVTMDCNTFTSKFDMK